MEHNMATYFDIVPKDIIQYLDNLFNTSLLFDYDVTHSGVIDWCITINTIGVNTKIDEDFIIADDERLIDFEKFRRGELNELYYGNRKTRSSHELGRYIRRTKDFFEFKSVNTEVPRTGLIDEQMNEILDKLIELQKEMKDKDIM